MGDLGSQVGKPIANQTIDPSGTSKNSKLMNPNAREDPEAVSGDNPQKAWIGGKGKPSPPYGPQGRNF